MDGHIEGMPNPSTRDKILTEGLRVVHQRGFGGASVRDIVQAAPSTWSYVESINNRILTGDLYKALKEARNLVHYEQELLENA